MGDAFMKRNLGFERLEGRELKTTSGVVGFDPTDWIEIYNPTEAAALEADAASAQFSSDDTDPTASILAPIAVVPGDAAIRV